MIYLDHNAITPVRPEAREAVLAALDVFGNPSSVHAAGRAARDLLDKARGQVARRVSLPHTRFALPVYYLIAPAEADPVSWDRLAGHYGLTHRFQVEWRRSARVFRRLDFVWYAQSAARGTKPDLIYTWLPQSAVLSLQRGFPVILEMHADVAGRFGAW